MSIHNTLLCLLSLFSLSFCCPCVSNCAGKSNGNYESCSYGCNYYASCWDGVLTDGRPCPWPTYWDDNANDCITTSTTCPCPPPTAQPTPRPTPRPITPQPTPQPTPKPITSQPTPQPTPKPITSQPTPQPTPKPITSQPTPQPTPRPITPQPTPQPTPKPITSQPTPQPTPKPITSQPTQNPSSKPTEAPTSNPTSFPTTLPTIGPIATYNPTKQPSKQPNTVLIAGGTPSRNHVDGEALENTDYNVEDEDGDHDDEKSGLALWEILLIASISVVVFGAIYWLFDWIRYKKRKKMESDVENIADSGEPGEADNPAQEPGDDAAQVNSTDAVGQVPDLPESSSDDDDTKDEQLYDNVEEIPKGNKERELMIKRKELLKLSTVKLAKMCREHNVSAKGSKADIVNRLLDMKKSSDDDDELYDYVEKKKGKTRNVTKGRELMIKRKALLKLSTVKLAKMCREQKVSAKGSKADIVNRLLDAMKKSYDDDDDELYEKKKGKTGNVTKGISKTRNVTKGRESMINRKELLKLSTVKLAKMCRQQNVSAKGTKADIVNRLLAAAKKSPATPGDTAKDDV